MAQRSGTKVFVSFTGTDIRDNFLSYLVKALRKKKIDVFVNERPERGEDISQKLLKAIEESLISLVIFTEDYASSRSCLEELAKIIESRERNEQIVIPIFYRIEPSDVRHQRGSYGISLDEHENKYDKTTVQNWRNASNKAANLSGYTYPSDFKNEAEFVEEIVACLVKLRDDSDTDTRQRDHFKSLAGIGERIVIVLFFFC